MDYLCTSNWQISTLNIRWGNAYDTGAIGCGEPGVIISALEFPWVEYLVSYLLSGEYMPGLTLKVNGTIINTSTT